jgi:Carboxypeptidase regulatory-like domain
MRQTAIIFLGLAAMALGQTGRVTGTVTDDSGAPVAGALVTASLQSAAPQGTKGPGGLPLFMPFPPKALSGATGDFEIDGLPAGTFRLCVEKAESSLLNPCLWVDRPASVEVSAAATASGVTVVAPRGTLLTVQILDAKGLLANPANNSDVRVGTSNGKMAFIPARVSGRDTRGTTMAVVVPRGQAALISVSSATYALADDTGKVFGVGQTDVPVSSAAVVAAASASATAPAVVTVQVMGRK